MESGGLRRWGNGDAALQMKQTKKKNGVQDRRLKRTPLTHRHEEPETFLNLRSIKTVEQVFSFYVICS